MRTRIIFLGLLASGVAAAAVVGGSGGGGGAGAVVDVLAELVGKNVVANSYTATNTTGPAFMSTGDRVDAVRLGTAPRATIGACQSGSVCIGPDDFGYTTKLYVWGDIITQMVQVRDSIDILGNAAILNNNGPVRITDADGLVINNGTPQKGQNVGTVTLDLAPIPNNACLPVLVAFPAAQLNDRVWAWAEFDLPDDVTVIAERVPTAGQVKLKACNNSNETSQNPDPGTFTIEVRR